MPLQPVISEYLNYCQYIKGLTKDTLNNYSRLLRNFQQTMNIHTIESIDFSLLTDFVMKGRMDLGWKNSSTLTYIMTLSAFFAWCVKKRYMDFDYTQELDLPRPEKKVPRKLSKKETETILRASYEHSWSSHYHRLRNHAILATFLYTGLRRRELCNLCMEDVDLENLILYVRMGKGNKDRIIPINHALAGILNTYIKERANKQFTVPFFFISRNGKKLGFNSLYSMRDDVVKASGTFFTIHMLRHTFATLMLEGGCDIFSLSKMMGHTDIRVTTQYLYATAEHLQGQLSKHPLNNPSSVRYWNHAKY